MAKFCWNCGGQLDDSARVCGYCGTVLDGGNPVPEGGYHAPAAVRTGRGKKKKKKGWVAAIAAVAVVAVVAVLLVCKVALGSSGDIKQEATISAFYQSDEGKTYFVYDGTLLDDSVDKKVRSLAESLDGTICAARTSEKVLYLVTEDGVSKIADDVYRSVLSADGTAVAYVDEDGVLRLYSVKKKTSKKIADDAIFFYDTDDYTCTIEISPDGKSVAYTVYDEDGTGTAYLYNDGKTVEIGEDYVPVCVSDSAKYTYCYKEDSEDGTYDLYAVSAKGERTKIASDIKRYYLYSNQDNTQLLFWSGDNCYVTEKGGDKVKVTGMSSAGSFYAIYDRYLSGNAWSSSSTVGQLQGHYYYDDENSLIYIDKDWNAEVISSNVSLACADDSGKTVFYLENGRLYKIDGAGAEAERLASDIFSFVCTSDGAAVYYIDSDGTLWYQKGTKSAQRIADDVESLTITHDDYALYLTDYNSNSGILYASKGGSSGSRIADDVYRIATISTVAYYYTDYDSSAGTYDLYAATKKTKFSRLLRDVMRYY